MCSDLYWSDFIYRARKATGSGFHTKIIAFVRDFDKEHGIGNILIPRLDKRNMSRRVGGYKPGTFVPYLYLALRVRLDSNPTRYSSYLTRPSRLTTPHYCKSKIAPQTLVQALNGPWMQGPLDTAVNTGDAIRERQISGFANEYSKMI